MMLKRMFDRMAQSEDGYSLAELLVVVGLMGVVLAVAWNVNFFINRASAQNEREAWFGAEIRTPLMQFDKLLMQNGQIEGVSGDYSISFFTDVDLDDVKERNVIKAQGGTLSMTSWVVNGANQNVGAPIRDVVFSTHNANQDEGVPLFTYYDRDGAAITSSDEYAGSARSVRTTIVVDYDGQVFSDSRLTFLRNRD